MTATPESGAPHPAGEGSAAEARPEGIADHPHNFDVQKELHRRIRNDPDYDDWEYGTEPLPHEAWLHKPDGREAEAPPA